MSKTAAQIRQSFLSFFEQHGHAVVRSSPLVPENDPTLLFTNAGMVQFKDVFTGREKRGYSRATSSQKCVRAGGKHNDLENVGRTARHHTFFEMLGNFSFGDYFKEEAIKLAYDWLTKSLDLDPTRMIFSVFEGEPGIPADDEARGLWKKIAGADADVRALGKADNFWMMGDTGPQGPCSEIYYWIGDRKDLDRSRFGAEPGPDGAGWVEIWNLVFMQFEKATKDSPLAPLPRPSIDTGAGLERVSAVVQGQRSNYDTDLLRNLVEYAGELAKKRYDAATEDGVSMRVLADHARAATFLIGDGVMPSNEGRGYVLRRIMRRAIRHGVRLGLGEGAYRQICERVIATMNDAYPDLNGAAALIGKVVDSEDGAFRRTIDRGLKLLDEELGRGEKIIAGPVAFKLYDTFGFPLDLTQVIATERGVTVDEAGFEVEMDKQRAGSKDFSGTGQKAQGSLEKAIRAAIGETKFLGYEQTEAPGRVLAILVDGAQVERITPDTNNAVVVVDQTPFYGESGGQVGDVGRLMTAAGSGVPIVDTQKVDGLVLHHLGAGLPLAVNDTVELLVDVERRNRTRANHSATHLLHLALKDVLGPHVAQKGSLVSPDRLRFDFAHFSPLTEDEKHRIEEQINREVLANLPAQTNEMGYDEARAAGAVALFGEKYGDRVRVLKVGGRSVELCGGTHVQRTGDIGLFKLVSDAGIAQGVRRIEAVTGWNAVKYVDDLERELNRASSTLKAPIWTVAETIERLQKDLKEKVRAIEGLQKKLAMGGGKDLLSSVRTVKRADGDVAVLATRSEVGDPKALRDVADQLRQKLGSGIVVIGGVNEGKVALVAAVTPDLTGKFSAGKLIAELSKLVGGKGGGKPDLAQGGGSDPSKLDEALAAVDGLLA